MGEVKIVDDLCHPNFVSVGRFGDILLLTILVVNRSAKPLFSLLPEIEYVYFSRIIHQIVVAMYTLNLDN